MLQPRGGKKARLTSQGLLKMRQRKRNDYTSGNEELSSFGARLHEWHTFSCLLTCTKLEQCKANRSRTYLLARLKTLFAAQAPKMYWAPNSKGFPLTPIVWIRPPRVFLASNTQISLTPFSTKWAAADRPASPLPTIITWKLFLYFCCFTFEVVVPFILPSCCRCIQHCFCMEIRHTCAITRGVSCRRPSEAVAGAQLSTNKSITFYIDQIFMLHSQEVRECGR